MTIQEASEKTHISVKKLKEYEEKGLLEFGQGISAADLEFICSIHFLAEMGMDAAEIKELKDAEGDNRQSREEQIRILRKYRFRLLEDIHSRQKSLDCLDYMIHKLKKR